MGANYFRISKAGVFWANPSFDNSSSGSQSQSEEAEAEAATT
jgi:hypothetical protein